MPDFNLVETPVATPSQCVLCGNHKGPQVDTRIDIRNGATGRLYICRICGSEIARLFGYVDGMTHADALDSAARTSVEAEQLRREVFRLEALERSVLHAAERSGVI